MNMITALLGATGLLLVVTVTILTARMMNNSNDPDEAEQAEIRRLRAELDALNAQQGQFNLPAPPVSSDPGPLAANPIQPLPQPSPSPISPDPLPIRSAPEAGTTGIPDTSGDGVPTRAELEAELARAEQENELLKEEAKEGLISKPMIEAANKQKARASTVKKAWLQAKVIEWVAKQPDEQSGGFAIIELHRDLQPGTVLAIRRQSGIYGQLKVDHIMAEEKNKASANPVRGTFPDGEAPVIKAGDELILPPFGS